MEMPVVERITSLQLSKTHTPHTQAYAEDQQKKCVVQA